MPNLFWHNGAWMDENPKLIGPMDHAFWLASSVFDGARAIDGCVPDLDRHCARAVDSARKIGLAPTKTASEIFDLSVDAVRRLPKDRAYYIRPMFFARAGGVSPDPATTEFVLAVHEWAMPNPTFTACLVEERRPDPRSAPTDAKTGGLYPNSARALRAANARGFDNAVVMDLAGHVAEFATANLFFAKDGRIITPAVNGTFLNGITRQRVITLLRDDGWDVQERTVAPAELHTADEIFNTGNFGKVMAVTKFEDRHLQPGPAFTRARKLYWDFMETARVV